MSNARHLAALAAIVFGMVLAASAVCPAAEHKLNLTPLPEGLKTASFTLYIPDNAKTVRGILLIHGHQGGSHLYSDKPDTDVKGCISGWRDLADEESCAMLQADVFYAERKLSDEELYKVNTPIGVAAIESALASLATASKHPELVNAPWVTTGLSWGGRQAYEYAKARPQKCAGFITIHGWLDNPADTDYAKCTALDGGQDVMKVPGLVMVADDDSTLAPMMPFVLKARASGALWAAAVEADLVHHRVGNQAMPKLWIKHVLKLRLPDDYDKQVVAGPVKLKQLTEVGGFLGTMSVQETPTGKSMLLPPSTVKKLKVQSAEVAPARSFKGEKAAAYWLPDAETAAVWLEFVTKGTIRTDEEAAAIAAKGVAASGAAAGAKPATSKPASAPATKPASGPFALLPGEFKLQTYRAADGLELRLRIFTPRNYDPKKRYPLLLAMHGGAAQKPAEIEKTTDVCADWAYWASPEVQNDHPCFILYPYSPRDMAGMQNDVSWHSVSFRAGTYDLPEKPTPGLRMVLGIVDKALRELPIDPNQTYVGGFSNGGYATWALIMYRPELFKKAIPICGGGDPKLVDRITHIPIWTAHGDRDNVVPVKGTRALVAALKAAGGSVEYSEWNCSHMWDWKMHISNRADFVKWLFAPAAPARK